MTTERGRSSGVPVRASVQRQVQRLASMASFRAAAEGHALEVLDVLVWLAKNASSEAVRVSAANAVLDRAHGRPSPGARAVSEDDADMTFQLEVQWLDPEKS